MGAFDDSAWNRRKKHHGQHMRTGWLLHPQYLSDRDNTLNNLLCETYFSNFYKGNLVEEPCDQAQAYIKNIHVSKIKYDGDLPAPSGQPITVNIEEIEKADDVSLAGREASREAAAS
ncbi:hypothetical protein LTR56_002333 [Elasticomyces elasticus]|nr:hypothetical protein LTR56_002333 [Elasticomyces elasticus]KAK3665897.1 hypothetical protein LTR22_003216 [Elasticomyces elasticus]KAK4929369.1 hypothetical protein LTR49_003973 [Elasticomyces elasticus]KAK5764658.1 hypothetical protein LTS12_005159 [Elasticomyces elasticus]